MTDQYYVFYSCPYCGCADQLKIGQSCPFSQLVWYESLSCASCGKVTEADGRGFPEDVVRNDLLAAGGRWDVVLETVCSMPVSAKALKEALALDSREALSRLRLKGGAVVYSGTKVEAQWLAGQLMRAGEAPRIRREGG